MMRSSSLRFPSAFKVAPRGAAPRRRVVARVDGFTLVELLVALLLSMLLAIALMRIQGTWVGRTQALNQDVAMRDDQARVAMDRIATDLESAGFMFGGWTTNCNALLTYNTAADAVAVHHPVDAQAATLGGTVGVVPSLAALTYPPAGSIAEGKTDVLAISMTADSSRLNDANRPMNAFPNAAVSPMTMGKLSMQSASTLTEGDIGIVQVPDGGQWACLRVPLTTVTPTLVTSSGTNMPEAYYTGFSAAMASEGFPYALSDAELFQGLVYDMGASTALTQEQAVYYIDNNGGSFPILKRALVNLADDSIVDTQDVAAGVVSMQVLYGVGATSISKYETAATVEANNDWPSVRSVKVAIIARSINADPDPAYAASGPVLVKPSSDTTTPFQNLTLGTSDAHHYTVQTTEIFYRNFVWRSGSSS